MSEEQKETTSQAEQLNQKTEEKSIQAQFEEKLGVNQEKQAQKSQISEEFKKNLNDLQIVLNSGLINQRQGQNLLNHIIQEAINKNVQNSQADFSTPICDKESVLKDFNNENSQFFNLDGRKEILNYLKADNINVDRDELSKIVKLVELVENSAVERYLQKVAHEKNIEKLNSQAKQKLQANAQNTKSDSKNFSVFTREQIGKMTSAEFLKHEPLIMEQLRKGLIK